MIKEIGINKFQMSIEKKGKNVGGWTVEWGDLDNQRSYKKTNRWKEVAHKDN